MSEWTWITQQKWERGWKGRREKMHCIKIVANFYACFWSSSSSTSGMKLSSPENVQKTVYKNWKWRARVNNTETGGQRHVGSTQLILNGKCLVSLSDIVFWFVSRKQFGNKSSPFHCFLPACNWFHHSLFLSLIDSGVSCHFSSSTPVRKQITTDCISREILFSSFLDDVVF